MKISFRDIKIYHEDYFFNGKCLKLSQTSPILEQRS
jgi:hypothetical protein